MKEFFKVTELNEVLGLAERFPPVGSETVSLSQSLDRVIAEAVMSDIHIPDFHRSTMDGFAVSAASTFGASEANPAYLTVKGAVEMGKAPGFSIGPGEAAAIATGGMLPEGADSVVMVEHTEALDDTTIEVYRSVAPGQHMVERGEDIRKSEAILFKGTRIRPQEMGLLAAVGRTSLQVFRRPVVGIISTGDEIVPVEQVPAPGRIRDVNSHTLAGQVVAAGGIPKGYGIVRDHYDHLLDTCRTAVAQCDMVLISGGSSVGVRDFTVEVLEALPDSRVLVHGITISPGKPTILAQSGRKPVWGLPGHVVSAMVVFSVVVRPFLSRISGAGPRAGHVIKIPAVLTRNLASAQGRIDYVRVRLTKTDGGTLLAEPILGKSGLIHTMVQADGLIAIDMNTEGLEKGAVVSVIPI